MARDLNLALAVSRQLWQRADRAWLCACRSLQTLLL